MVLKGGYYTSLIGMAAYWVKMIPWVGGIGILGSGGITLVSWKKANDLKKENTRLNSENMKYYMETIHLAQSLVDERAVANKEKRELMEQLEQNRWTTKLVGAGIMGATALGGLVGYTMRPMR
jgi:hypothetical protein